MLARPLQKAVALYREARSRGAVPLGDIIVAFSQYRRRLEAAAKDLGNHHTTAPATPAEAAPAAPAATVVMVARPASRKEREDLGADTVITPARRSTRKSTSGRQSLAATLEAANVDPLYPNDCP